jgi:putative transposase
VKANQATHAVRVMCRLLNISASGFYAWDERPLSVRAREDIALTARIHAIHRRSNGAYGAPMIHAELADDHDIHVGCKRVARLMRAAGLQGVSPKRFARTTISEEDDAVASDLVDRKFEAGAPDRLWVADISVPQQAA